MYNILINPHSSVLFILFRSCIFCLPVCQTAANHAYMRNTFAAAFFYSFLEVGPKTLHSHCIQGAGDGGGGLRP
jgi:hypothetical protein